MANRYKKLQPKLKPLPFIIMGVIIVLFVVFLIIMTPTAKQRIANDYNARGAEIPKDHVFVEISYKEYEKKRDNKENFVLYIGALDCQSCITEIKYYDMYFKSEGLEDSLKNVYYINSKKLSEKQIETLQTLIQKEFATPQLMYFHQGSMLYTKSDLKYTEQTDKIPGQVQLFYKDVLEKQ